MSDTSKISTYYSLEGNIGSGKSTFINILDINTQDIESALPNINNTRVIEEPVDMWQNMNGSNVLESFYNEDIVTFQMQHLLELNCKQLIIKIIVLKDQY